MVKYDPTRRMSLAFMVSVALAAGGMTAGADILEEGTLRLARVLPDDPLFPCIAQSEFVLAGLSLYDPLERLGPLGAPESLLRGWGEDDGGGYVATTYRYDGLDVTVVRDDVDVIAATGSRWATAGGLRPGLTRSETLTILGHTPDPEYLNDGVYSFPACPEWRDGALTWHDSLYFEFGFGAEDRLAFIRLVADRP